MEGTLQYDMNIKDIFYVSASIITSLGGSALIIFAFSTWLGKVWANRILEQDRAKYSAQIEVLKNDLSKSLHEHKVAVSRIDEQRAIAIQLLYSSLIEWFEIALEIKAPNSKFKNDKLRGIKSYKDWSLKLSYSAQDFAKQLMKVAIYVSPETYDIVTKCGLSITDLSVKFTDVCINTKEQDVDTLFEIINSARDELEKDYQTAFEPARIAIIQEFRSVIDPNQKNS